MQRTLRVPPRVAVAQKTNHLLVSLRGTITGRLSSSPSSRERIERSPGWFGLFRLLRPCIGAEHMAKGRQDLYVIAHDLRDCQQWSRE